MLLVFLNAIDVPLEHFFQALWKHVICLEYIKLRFGVDSESRSQNLWHRIREYYSRDNTKAAALNYLERWESKFWIGFDENIREITRGLESNVEANFALELEKFRTDAGYARKLSEDRKSHLQQRLKRFVDTKLLSDLSQVINLLSEYDVDKKAPNYIIVDRLDESWVDVSVKYQLIRALIEALKGMRRIGDLKVIVALRSDVLEKVISETKEEGFQSEKYEDYLCRINWSHDQLKELVEINE